MLKTLKALADPTRLRLLAVLARGEFTVQELTAILSMGQSRISRHLKILVAAGILSVKRQGTWGYYRLGEKSPFFRAIWPSLEGGLDLLAERRSDLEGVARILEARQSRSREFFDRHARQWDELARTLLPVADYLTPLLDKIPPCATLLEVGVGTGGLLGSLRQRADRVIGVDHSPAMLEEARNRLAAEDLAGVELRLGEMAHLPLSDGEVQVAILNMVLHHAPQPSEVLAELARVLAPGGTLLIADLARHEKEWLREQMADQWLGFGEDELQGWLSAAGFDGADCRLVAGLRDEQGVLICRALRR